MLIDTLFAVALLAQRLSSAPFGSSLERLTDLAQTEKSEASVARAHQASVKLQEQEFVGRFNELASALEAFSHSYKSDHVINVKKVEAIRKAYRKLEKADPWFHGTE